jgi:hypothetical protein
VAQGGQGNWSWQRIMHVFARKFCQCKQAFMNEKLLHEKY